MLRFKDARWLIVPFSGYILASKIQGDAIILTSLDYLDNLGVSEVGWKMIVRTFYVVAGNSANSQDLLVRIIQLASIYLIASAANKSCGGLGLGMLLLAFFTPIAIKMQIRLGLGLAIFLYGYGRLVRKEKRALATMLIAATVHQGVLLVSILIVASRLFVEKLDLIRLKSGNSKSAWARLLAFFTLTGFIVAIAFKSSILQSVLQTPLRLLLEYVTAFTNVPAASTALSVLNRSESIDNTSTVVFTILLVILLLTRDWKYVGGKLNLSLGRCDIGYLERSSEFAFCIMALFNIGFSGLYYFGRIGTTSYIFYCLVMMGMSYRIGNKTIGLVPFWVPSMICLIRF
jgi:hypothetical protein